MTKFQVAIITLLIGFMLGQITDFLKYWWSTNRKKKALFSEIEDISCEFNDSLSKIVQIINDYDKGFLTINWPKKIDILMYQAHYSEVAPLLTRLERKEINIIYAHANYFNLCLAQNNNNNPKAKLVKLYTDCKLGYESVLSMNDKNIKVLLRDRKEKLNEINNDIDNISKLAGL